jgi:hypothetical protein
MQGHVKLRCYVFVYRYFSAGIAGVDRRGGAGLSGRLRQNFGNDFAEEKSGCDKDGNLLGRSGFR